VDGIKEPKKVEMALWKIIPPEEGSDFCHRLVFHGRAVCTARTKPYCDKCCLQDVCKENNKKTPRKTKKAAGKKSGKSGE
jgi:endonuclease-3